MPRIKWSPALWDLSVRGRDVDGTVQWPAGPPQDRIVPPLILFAYFTHFNGVPRQWRSPLRRPGVNWALRKIFRTGNKPPSLPFHLTPQSLQQLPDGNAAAPPESLARWRSEKEFRACLWLDGIRLWRENGLTHFATTGTYQVGYTPPEVKALNDRPAFPNLGRGYQVGTGTVWQEQIEPVFHSWGAQVKIDVGFRIDAWLAKLGNYYLFSSGVPYMRMTLNLDVRSAGGHRIEYNGSAIPTQVYQTGDAAPYVHDMVEDIGRFDVIASTLGAGRKAPAWPRPAPEVRYLP